MKTNALLSSPISVDEFPAGTIALVVGTQGPKNQRRQERAPQLRIGMALAGNDRTVWLERVAFIILWLCGVFSVGYSLKTLLSLPWPG